MSTTNNIKISVLVNQKRLLKFKLESANDLNIQFNVNVLSLLQPTESINVDIVFPNIKRVPIFSHKEITYKFDNKDFKYQKLDFDNKNPLTSTGFNTQESSFFETASFCPFKLVSNELCFRMKVINTIDPTIECSYFSQKYNVKNNKYYFDDDFNKLERRKRCDFDPISSDSIFYTYEVT